MSKFNLMQRLGSTLAVLGAAREAAIAVDAQRKPSRAALTKLGVDPQSFDEIRFFGLSR